jgi:hypothetical protein
MRVKNFLAFYGTCKYYPSWTCQAFHQMLFLRRGIDSSAPASKTGGLSAAHDSVSTVFRVWGPCFVADHEVLYKDFDDNWDTPTVCTRLLQLTRLYLVQRVLALCICHHQGPFAVLSLCSVHVNQCFVALWFSLALAPKNRLLATYTEDRRHTRNRGSHNRSVP